MKQRKGVMGAIPIVQGVIAVIFLLVVAAIMFGQIKVINGANLGNNSNANAMIDIGFGLLFTTSGIYTLVVALALLGLALAYVFGVFGSSGTGKR